MATARGRCEFTQEEPQRHLECRETPGRRARGLARTGQAAPSPRPINSPSCLAPRLASQEGHPNSPEGSGRAQPLQSQPDGQPDGQLGRGALPRRKRGGVRERERKERERMRDMEQRRRAAEREMERTLNRERDRLMATVAAGGPAAGFVPLHAHAPPQHPVMVPSVPPKPPPRAPAPPPRSAAQSSTHARPLPASGARPPAPVASATPPANPPSAPAPPARPSAPLDPPPVPLSRETAERRRQAMLQQRASSAGRTAEHAPEAAPRPPPRAHPPPAASASVAVGARAPPAQAPSAAEPVTEEWKEKQASVGIPEGRSVCAAPPSTVSATAEPVVAHCIDELRSFGAKSRAAVLMETQRQMVKALWTGRDDMVSWLEGARKNGEEELSAVMSSLSDFFGERSLLARMRLCLVCRQGWCGAINLDGTCLAGCQSRMARTLALILFLCPDRSLHAHSPLESLDLHCLWDHGALAPPLLHLPNSSVYSTSTSSSPGSHAVRVRLGSSQLPQQLRDAGAKYAVMRVISVSPDPSSPSDFVVSGTIPFSAAPAEQKLRFASNAAPEDGEVEAWVTSVPRPREISQAECNRLRVLRKGLAAAAGPAPGSG